MSSNLAKNLLVELFVEELPPKALKKLGESFAASIFESLNSDELVSDESIFETFATPRRLAVLVSKVNDISPPKKITAKLMPAAIGLDANGNPTPALIKKLISTCGYNEEADFKDIVKARVAKEHDGKTDVLFHTDIAQGKPLSICLQYALDEALVKLPIPKVMTYQINDGWESVNFVRPAHGLVALHGTQVVPTTVLGLSAGNSTQGHRFEAKNATITIQSADSYAQQLADEGAVIASFAARKAEIVRQLTAAAAKENLTPIDDDALLDEVTALVELPNVLLGQFEQEFLEVPQECLILTMKANQKYFPLLDANGKLTHKFLIVSNIKPADPSKVIGGNERVVRPRLADAKFFFDQDRKKTLESRIDGLAKVVYHNKLGSQGERNARVVAIAKAIAEQINPSLTAKAIQAARLSKVDLLTDMVGEFPELQGIMGRYYAQHEGLDDDVAFAIEDHYKPRFAGDDLPRHQVGVIVALADKLETLVGLFSIGEKPTGDKDPFALRRQALGIIRMLIDAALPLSLNAVMEIAFSQFVPDPSARAAVKEFCYDRLSVNLRDQGASAQEVDAVLSLTPELLSEVPARLAAVRSFASLVEAPALAAANKRVGNILKKVEGELTTEVNANLLQEPAEKALADALTTVKPKADQLFESGDYTASLQALAVLKAPVDAFFDNVMVNADNVDLRNNRLALLNQLHQAMNRVADLSKLAS
ncbi:glycine--tRNA ligase subunit beta [Methylotenera sp. N17]|uniref:glycine--tRNA ligase subunit beta n=1 Tax=Methylotenera sp. N17 TaxID=1502761 RepID=UPI0006490E6F|nr:glycine--tRNA ligase subunit beta [Methylotenera sp. N17]